ncbi:MAG TPA: hypothetical protein VFZ00_11290 [Solirubrobacter sp.]|nr:hypothetical protein [Solirubrobacter sp.]
MTLTASPDPNPQPTTPASAAPAKPGYKTSEFWLKVAAFALTALFAGGVIPTSGPVAQVAAIAATMLGALGYTVGRSLVKAASAALILMALGTGVASMTACGSTSKAAGKDVLSAAVDCTAPDRAKLEAQIGPTIELALQRSLGADGKIDLPSLDQIGHTLELDGWCVLETEAAKLIAWATTKVGTASAAQPFDAKDLASKLAAMRAAKFGATQFKLAAAHASIEVHVPEALGILPHSVACGDLCVESYQCTAGCADCRNSLCTQIQPRITASL